ncbi:MAG: hypothetical protein H0U75_08490 [Legionella sp.]|nr:hypothetical protein [Legionella sp.]
MKEGYLQSGSLNYVTKLEGNGIPAIVIGSSIFTWLPTRNHFKNLTIRLFEKSSHTPQLEEPKLFDNEL